MTGTLTTLRFNTQAQQDIQRIMRDLTDLQRQTASAVRSNELAGYGVGAARLLNTQGLVTVAQAHANAAQQLEARFGVQSAALGQAAAAAGGLAQSLKDAVTNDNADALPTELSANFAIAVSALNESWNGQPLFAGERLDGSPISVGSVEALGTVSAIATIFDESSRSQIVQFGAGGQITLAPRASEVSAEMFAAMRDLKQFMDLWPNGPPDTLSQGERNSLTAIAERLEGARETLIAAEGETGQLGARITAERQRQQDRATLLQREVGEQSDADIALVSIQVNTLLAQYEATAKTFADISRLSLLNYLR